MSKYKNIKSEHQLRSLVFDDYFKTKGISWEQEISNIDFVVTDNKSRTQKSTGADKHYVWMETKKSPTDHYIMLVQLVLTIKKPYSNNDFIVPNYIGCFDTEKIVFVPMKLLQSVMHDNDIKWNITPSDTKNEYFLKILNKLKYNLHGVEEFKIFKFKEQDEEIKDFIKENVYKGVTENKFEITEHNFDRVYLKWVDKVKPTILINWDEEKSYGLHDGDFFLADLMSRGDTSIKDKLLIVLQNDHYKLTKALKRGKKLIDDDKYFFKDKQKAYNEFWSIYKRPPLPVYWDNIIDRKDLLVPQDIRETKGSFFTPQIWVELSQSYIADVLGQNWQDKYYVWDCCAGTGNLLVGINRKLENVFASTLDNSDVKAMHDRIDNGAQLLKKNVFQFDFLNDSLTSSKVPKALKEILSDSKKRKKLIIYINPPYAEASKMRTLEGGKEGTKGVEQSKINEKYGHLLGQGKAELFVQFLTRIYQEIKGCYIAEFSTLKIISGQHFIEFRKMFLAKNLKSFVCPANTFDNVKGSFPIGFMIWNTSEKTKIKKITADVYDAKGKKIGKKNYYSYDNSNYINDWVKPYRGSKDGFNIGKFPFKGNDFQNQNLIAIVHPDMDYNVEAGQFLINANNLIIASIYFAVRKVIPADWLNDRDQFEYPNDKWENDTEFHNDCFAYTLFNNTIQLKYGDNHWIPFTKDEVNARDEFKSKFMSNFIKGIVKEETNSNGELFEDAKKIKHKQIKFSKEAKDVYNAGKELWKYYHSFSRVNINAGLYEIKLHFQGETSGRMNVKSTDEKYNQLMSNLRSKLKTLAEKIEPKVYEYGFLKK